MAVQILMPALSPTMTEGTLARWLVAEGEDVRSGDVIAEIETDKATMEVEAIDDGIMGKILIAAGTENVAVNSVIGLLAEDGEDVSTLELPSAPTATQAPTPAPAVEPAAAPQPEAIIAETHQAAPAPAPVAAPAASLVKTSDRVFASPLARRIAAQNNIEINGLTGSGPYGRIIKADVEAAMSAPRASTATLPDNCFVMLRT